MQQQNQEVHSKPMTGLLVSVRSLEEAKTAYDAGADIIDVKEPLRGSLGAASLETIQAIVNELASKVPISVACGELGDLEPSLLQGLPAEVSFAKIGLAGCAAISDWRDDYRRALARLPNNVRRVAVAYADWQTSNTPDPESILAEATSNRCDYFLLDTKCKTTCLMELLPKNRVTQWTRRATALGLRTVIAGSLSADQFEDATQFWLPNFLAVRGAVCEHGRESQVCGSRVKDLRARLDSMCQPATKMLDIEP